MEGAHRLQAARRRALHAASSERNRPLRAPAHDPGGTTGGRNARAASTSMAAQPPREREGPGEREREPGADTARARWGERTDGRSPVPRPKGAFVGSRTFGFGGDLGFFRRRPLQLDVEPAGEVASEVENP